jgi:probable O-glycosylation ligase (exosortase A-associated)
MRDIGVFILLLPLFVIGIRNGYLAYVLWGWAGLASIQSYVYGFMLAVPLVQIFAGLALVKYFLGKDSERAPFVPNPTSILFTLFAMHITLSATFAYDGHPRNWEFATNMLKTVLFCVLMPMLVTSRLRLHALVIVIAVATGFHGLVDGLKFIASGGGHLAAGIQKFGDNNHFAMVLLMAIPLVAYAYQYSANRIVKLGFLGMLPLLVFAVIATQSRGALVCLIIMGGWFLLTSRRKFAGLLMVAACAMLVVTYAPEGWVARMNTIENAGQDSSLMGRVGAWQVSSAIALNNPVFGGGPHTIEIGPVWNEHRDAPGLLGFMSYMDLNGLPGRGRAAHSIYFEVLGDMGFVGLFIFVAILINAFVTVRFIVRIAKSTGAKLEWARSLAQMLALSLVAYVVAGALLSAAYFELPYILIMLLQVLKMQVEPKQQERSAKSIALNADGLIPRI